MTCIRNSIKCSIFIISLSSFPAFADSISVGYLSILSDSPTSGEQELTISNLTGPGNCYASYPACTNLDFTNWTLTVNYTSTYYNGTGPAEPAPFVFTSATHGGDLTPSSPNNTFDFDLCGGAGSCADPGSPITSITSVEFSGQISPSSFCLYDPSVLGCNPITPVTFFANPNFDLVWNGSSPQSPYVDENSNYAQSPDITVADQTVNSAPEPRSIILLTALLPFVWFARRRARKMNLVAF